MNIINRYKQLGERSRKSIFSIVLSFGAKGISVLVSLLIVPITINYVNPTRYGIWLTLSSIIGWIGFFDLGLGNGMRNKFAEAKARGELELARQYVSTTYFIVGLIIIILLVFVEVVNHFISWPALLNVDPLYDDELRNVFSILTAFFCLDMVVRLFVSLLTADQKPGLASWVGVIGQIISLGVIYILTKVSHGSLINLALYYSGIPALVLLVSSIYAFNYTSYKQFSPSFKTMKFSLVKDVLGLGSQFFFIGLCLLVIFQLINIIISREMGPGSVTEYNIAYKYFNIAHSILNILLIPFWSAFTEAYQNKDVRWMRKVTVTLERIWLGETVAIIFMIIIADWFYNIWIGSEVSISSSVTIAMAIYIGINGISAIYMCLINGIGTIRVQLVTYIIFALTAWPLMNFTCRYYGIAGVLMVPTLVFLVQAVLGKIQLKMLLNGRAKGVWAK